MKEKGIINQNKVNLDTKQKNQGPEKVPGKISLTFAWHLSRPLLGWSPFVLIAPCNNNKRRSGGKCEI